MNELDPAAIAAAQQTLRELVQVNADYLLSFSLAEAIAWLETQLPDLRDLADLLTWANAAEQLADTLPPSDTLWVQALQTEGYMLRLRARALPLQMSSYTP